MSCIPIALFNLKRLRRGRRRRIGAGHTVSAYGQAVWRKGVAVVLGLLFVGLALSCGLAARRWIDTPFPGFFVLANRVVASVSLPHWSVAGHGEIYQYAVVAVNGQAVATSQDIYTAVRQLPVGSPITYTLDKGEQTFGSELPSQRLASKTMSYCWRLPFYWPPIAFIGLGSGSCSRPARPAGRCLLGRVLLGFFFLTAIDLYSPHWFFPSACGE